jgi:O-antigen ligase
LPRKYDFVIFLALLSGPPRFRTRDIFATFRNEMDWSVLLNIGVWCLGALWVFHHLFSMISIRRRLPRFQRTQILALALIYLLSMSTLLSPSFYLTLFRIFQLTIMILFGYIWVNKYDIDITLKYLLYSYAVLGIVLVVFAVLDPAMVYKWGRLRGENVANTGAVAAMGFILLLSYPAFRSRLLQVGCLILFAFLLIACRTRSAYVSVIIFLLIALLKAPWLKRLQYLRYLIAVLSPFILLFFDFIASWLIREPENVYSLNNRLFVWDFLITYVWKTSPLIGLGFFTERYYTFPAGLNLSAHNAILEIFYGGGILSLIVFMTILMLMFYLALKLYLLYGREPISFTVFNLFLAVFLIGLVSEDMVVATPTGFTFYMLVALIPSAYMRHKRMVE